MCTEISQRTVYTLNGLDYKTLGQVKTKVENDIGALIDSLQPRLNTREALAVFDLITKNHKDLTRLLNVVWEGETESALELPREFNILDL